MELGGRIKFGSCLFVCPLPFRLLELDSFFLFLFYFFLKKLF